MTPLHPAGTTLVRETHRFDEAALARYLQGHVAGFSGSLAVRQFEGGQSNPTFYLIAGGREYVMRKKPPGRLLPSAHAVDREHRVLTALGTTAVPVPRTFALCEDESVIGTAFYIMEYVPGRVFRDPRLPGMEAPDRAAIYKAMVAVLAALHLVTVRAVGLDDFGKPGNYYSRQIARWTGQYEASKTGEIEPMNRLMAWLPIHVPAGDEIAIVHGDYRLENLIFHPAEPRVLAVLDWELSTIGHPLADLAYNCVPYHLAASGLGGLEGLDRAAIGIPAESTYVAEYCRQTGRGSIERWDFYLAFALFRLAGIAQGVYARGLQGNASSETAREHGALVGVLAERAWALVDR